MFVYQVIYSRQLNVYCICNIIISNLALSVYQVILHQGSHVYNHAQLHKYLYMMFAEYLFVWIGRHISYSNNKVRLG